MHDFGQLYNEEARIIQSCVELFNLYVYYKIVVVLQLLRTSEAALKLDRVVEVNASSLPRKAYPL